MDIKELLECRALHDAILYLDARITKLEEAATKPDTDPKPEVAAEEEEES